MKLAYRNYDVEIKTIFYTRQSNDLTPVVEIAADGSLKLLLTTQFFPTAQQAEQYGVKMARKWIRQYDGKRNISRN